MKKMKNIFSLSRLLLLFSAMLTFTLAACTEDYERDNLYPEVKSEFTYTYDQFTRTLNFTNNSSGEMTYLWDFGDGTTSTEENPQHQYAADGTYTVTLKVKNVAGTETTSTQTIQAIRVFPLLLPIDFESANINYAFADFGGAVGSKVANPDKTGMNTSTNVGKVVKTAGAETWAGNVLSLYAPIEFGNNNGFKVKVWSPKAGAVVKLKLENNDNADLNFEVDARTTVANQWEELSFNFSGRNTGVTYQKVILFFDFGNWGDGASYYFDDVKLAYITDISYQEDFENFTKTWTDFGNATTTVVANPHATGINTSSKVGKFVKNAGAETWAGSFYQEGAALPFTSSSEVKIWVYSPAAGKTVKFKVENATDGGKAFEVDATTTVANQWEELTFNMNGLNTANTYHKIILFFDFGNWGDGSAYYFDNVRIKG